MIEQLMALGFNAGAAKFLADEITAGRKQFSKIEFSAKMDLRFVSKANAEYGEE